ncbi:toll-like receptor 3 [Asterias rubens]|uniref:toll-like receptor 3 n=1 Tax=Asterias rubens TaxID=7604 RepID=UPI0014558575|nr:toll-like receptor 3 [Asterias rubens]
MEAEVPPTTYQPTIHMIIMKWSALVVVLVAIVFQTGILPISSSAKDSDQLSDKFPCRIVNATFTDCSYLRLRSIPEGIPISTETLLLSHNKLHPISSSSLAGLVNLRYLDMSYNTISKLERDYFTDQAQLQHLFLSHNQINKIPPDAFMSVSKLKTLDLSDQNNGIKKALSMPQYLEPLNMTLETLLLEKIGIDSAKIGGTLKIRLKVFSLARNSITKLNQDDFKALSGARLERLDLSRNAILSIDTKVFNTILGIDTLNFTQALSQNPPPGRIENISTAIGTKVKKLILQSLTLQSITSSMFRGLENSTLEELDLSYNRLTTLTNASFGSYLSHLQILQLHNNLIASISETALTGLTSLKTLALFNNLLTEIDPGSFAHNGHLEDLYLNNNSIKRLSSEGSFRGLISLRTLNLSNNGIIQIFTGEEFQDLHELLSLDISNNFLKSGIITLTGNSFKPLSKLKYLRLKKIHLLDISSPSPFAHLVQLHLLDLSNNNMHGLESDTFVTLKSLETLYLDHNHLNNLWYQPKLKKPVLFLRSLVSLRTLDLSFNGFEAVPTGVFNDLVHLKALHLNNNQLSAVSGHVFDNLKELQFLALNKNLINVVNQTLLSPVMKTLNTLFICGNPFSCGCKQEWFRDWIDDTNIFLGNLSLCQCESPPEWRHKPLLDFNPEVLNCDGKIPLQYWIIIGVGNFVILVLIIALIYNRWKIYYVYLLVKARHHRARKDEYDRLNDYRFDAFISHSSADEDWVKDKLLPELENGENPFKVCHHERDFEPGQEIIDNIIDSVDHSRRTICVISKSYLESNWCTYERRVTMSKLFINYKDVLVLIILEDIPDKKMSKYDLIHRAVKKNTYLKWPGEDGRADEKAVFWQRLKTVLGEDRTPENNEELA